MGFKKGRAARAAHAAQTAAEVASQERSAADAELHIRHDGGTCVTYIATNGSEYRIDVARMDQVNVKKGTSRAVFRHRGHGTWTMWQYEAQRAEGRNYTHSRKTYIQYPKWVASALEQRWKVMQGELGDCSAAAVATAQWRRAVADLDDATLRRVMELIECQQPGSTSPSDIVHSADEPKDELEDLVRSAVNAEALRQVLADIVLQACWPTTLLVRSLRCLLRCGLQAKPKHCRIAAMSSGSLAVLRVLLIEANVDVCGLALFESGSTSAKKGQAEGSWVHRCKGALKALMGRGATLGSNAPRSKLLKKIEEDGDALWVKRALESIRRNYSDLPDCILQRIQGFFHEPAATGPCPYHASPA